MVLVQKFPFFQLLFLGNIQQENVFYDILERKNAFLSYKNNKFKKSKNCNFSKGVNPWFWSKKKRFFKFFFLRSIGLENLFYDILERKSAFLAYKNKKFKMSKRDIFPKALTHGFVQKWPFFQLFFYSNIKQEKVFYDILKRKKTPL